MRHRCQLLANANCGLRMFDGLVDLTLRSEQFAECYVTSKQLRLIFSIPSACGDLDSQPQGATIAFHRALSIAEVRAEIVTLDVTKSLISPRQVALELD